MVNVNILVTPEFRVVVTTFVFAQNIVRGGTPDVLATRIALSQNSAPLFFLFRLSSMYFRNTKIVIEYMVIKTVNLFIDLSEARIIQELLFIDDSAIILFTPFFDISLRGVIKVSPKISRILLILHPLAIRLDNKPIGITFCHVISNINELFFISILFTIFINHRWRGHTPIFAISLRVTIVMVILFLIKNPLNIVKEEAD